MNPLHRRDHPKLTESRDVLGRQVLRMFDPPSEIVFGRIGLERLLEDIQRLAVCPIANCVHAQLVIIGDCQARRFCDVGNAGGVQAGALGLVAVRLEQPRSARTERTIDLPLDRAHGQVTLSVVDGPIL
jgi:hypothetical protein